MMSGGWACAGGEAAHGFPALTLREIALPFVEDVQAAVHQLTTQAVLNCGTVLYLERLSVPRAALDAPHVAQRMPIHTTSPVLVLLTHSPPRLQ